MLNSKSFLAVDFGASSLKVAEFEISETGGLRLKQYGLNALGAEGMQESTREPAMIKALQALLAEKPYGARNVNACAPGFHVFSKFVKLPPVDTSKVTQIIQYEAQQNVPFPLEEVVWDYQILGTTSTGELEVFLVAIKTDIVEGLFRVAESAGLRLQLADVSPAALCNAFRYNYGDLDGCTMLLDIGAKTSNLLFFEKGGVYARGINIGANSITQEFAKEAKLPFGEAERIKIAEGFVSLGGAYEEPDSPHQAAISKIARQVMTRLHIQVNQTIQFYRGQQGGSAPQRLFLSGGAAIMPYASQFFAEKLNVPVDYFNPFRNVQIDPSLNLEELAKVAHSYGEVVGLGLRNLAHCPIELNLMPRSSLRRQEILKKQPYFVATVFSLFLVVFAYGLFYKKLAAAKTDALEKLKVQTTPLKADEQTLQDAMGKLKGATNVADQYLAWFKDRTYWASTLSELRRVMMDSERRTKAKIGVDTGVWVEKLTPVWPEGFSAPVAAAEETAPNPFAAHLMMSEELRKRYGLDRAYPSAPTAPAPEEPAEKKAGKPSTNEVTAVTLLCRAVSVKQQVPTGDNELRFNVVEELKASTNYFLSDETKLVGEVKEDETNLTYSFEIQLKLKRGMKLF